MRSKFGFEVAVQTVAVATSRVVLPLITVPPPPLAELYHTYVALNPLVTHVYVTLFVGFLSFCTRPLTSKASTQHPLHAVVPPLLAHMYAFHPWLAQDNRTHKTWDARLLLLSIIVSLRTIPTVFPVFAEQHRSADPQYTQGRPYSRLRRLIHERCCLGRLTWMWIDCLIVCGLIPTIHSLSMAPAYMVWLGRGRELSWADYAIEMFALCGIWVLWVYQWHRRLPGRGDAESTSRTKEAGQYFRGMLYKYGQLLSEIVFGLAVYLLGVTAGAPRLNWTLAGLLVNLIWAFGSSVLAKLYQTDSSRLGPRPSSTSKKSPAEVKMKES